MEHQFPIRVVVMDSDRFALKGLVGLLARDFRTLVCGETDNLQGLMRLAQQENPMVILLDVESPEIGTRLGGIIDELRTHVPSAVIVCMAKEVNVELIQEAMTTDTQGFVIKNEIYMGIVAAIVRARAGVFVHTPGVCRALEEENYHISQRECLPQWQPNPELSPRQMHIALMRVVYGTPASLAASKLFVQPETVDKYMSDIYKILECNYWMDEQDFDGMVSDLLSKEEKAFVRFTALPKKQEIYV